MTEQERIDTLLTALESALALVDDTMRYTAPMSFEDIAELNRINDSLRTLEAYAKHEREKRCILEEKKVGE